MKRKIFFILLLLGIIGIIDSSYLTYEHYANVIPPCTVNNILPFFNDCGQVLRSRYAVIFGVPLALLGLIHYTILTLVIGLAISTNKKLWWFWLFFQTAAGAFFSVYLMYLQLFVIKSLCLYCTLSALTSFILFFLAFIWLEYERKTFFIYALGWKYRNIIKPIFFMFNPEHIHNFMVNMGQLMGMIAPLKKLLGFFLRSHHPILSQDIAGIHFSKPIGLSAGFDYEAKLTQILPCIDFGFETVGTITNHPYEGNPKPMLGRLPKSKSLMVNKGFKNLGSRDTVWKLRNLHFEIPLGISIGRTNGIKNMTQKQSVEDVVQAFKKFENSDVINSYYELNISCPNLFGDISFYPPKNLQELLNAIGKLNVRKPVFVKMPIEKTDRETLEMLEIISKYKFIKGVIFGNLQKNRKDRSLDPQEVKKWKVGNFSGKPCEKRSNEFIKLAYGKYKKRFIIIGCGGVFSGSDAYRKIRLGASLVQLITGMIYQGPALIAQINFELAEKLKQDGYKHISEAIGADNN